MSLEDRLKGPNQGLILLALALFNFIALLEKLALFNSIAPLEKLALFNFIALLDKLSIAPLENNTIAPLKKLAREHSSIRAPYTDR